MKKIKQYCQGYHIFQFQTNWPSHLFHKCARSFVVLKMAAKLPKAALGDRRKPLRMTFNPKLIEIIFAYYRDENDVTEVASASILNRNWKI